MRRRCDSDKCAFSTDKLQSILPSIFFIFYRHRAAREQYFNRFIVAVQRGNNIFAVLSSPRGAETIFLPIYRHRAAREQYFCQFIVAVQRENSISANLSSPCSAETIFLPIYRRRAARERYLCVSVLAALLRALKFLFPPLQNGDVCWNGRGGCLCARPNVRVAAFPYLIDTFSNRKMEDLSSVPRTLLVFDERTDEVIRPILCISTQTNKISRTTTVNSRMLIVFL